MSALPDWALRALGHFKPLPGYRGDAPDPDRLRHWHGFSERFTRRWADLAPDGWGVPDDHPSYAGLRRSGYVFPPSEYVRQGILESAIEAAWEMGANKKPADVVAAVREMDRLNEKISEVSEQLATLFRLRDQLRTDYGLSDQGADTEAECPDAFRLSGVLELTLSKDRFRTSSWDYKEGLQTLYEAMASSRREAPTIADVLDEISWRQPRRAAPFEAGDIAVVGSRPASCAWWHQVQPQAQPSTLDHLREAARALEAGEPVPRPAARVLIVALRGYLDGTQTDITRALGLRPRKGGAAELPTRLERTQRRNELIGRMFHALDGGDVDRAERVARLLTEPQQRSEINEADLFACMEQLHQQHGAELPTSGRHILRIVRGETVAARRA